MSISIMMDKPIVNPATHDRVVIIVGNVLTAIAQTIGISITMEIWIANPATIRQMMGITTRR